MRSLRARLLVGTMLASAAVMGVLALAIDLSLRRTLVRQFDAGLASNAYAIAAMVEVGHDGVRIDPDALVIPEFQPGRRPAYFEVWVGGKTVARSPSLAARDLAADPPSITSSTAAVAEGRKPGHYHVQTVMLPDGHAGRLLTMRFHPTPEPADGDGEQPPDAGDVMATLALAQNTYELEDTLDDLRWLTIGLCAAATLLSGGALLVVVTRATRPVRRLADQIGGLSATDLATAISVEGLPAELRPVADRLNGLLERVSAAFSRERAFTADAAHELRTPLAGLLATLEVCRQRPRDSAGYEVAIDKSLVMLTAMQGMVDNLLLLARAEGGQLTLRPTEVDLSSLAYECWAMFDGRAARRRLRVTFEVPEGEGGGASCDREFARMVVSNLLDNAVCYADEGGTVRVAVERRTEEVVLRVTNSGNQLVADDVAHVFERFWRKESARSQTGLHAGLGLSLCRRLMTLQEGRLEVEAAGEEFRVVASFATAK